MMTEEEFDKRWKKIEAHTDREMAMLCHECGWTQERIAERVGISQSRISQLLIFGQFLQWARNTTMVVSLDDLPERKFREAWIQSHNQMNRNQYTLDVLEGRRGNTIKINDSANVNKIETVQEFEERIDAKYNDPKFRQELLARMYEKAPTKSRDMDQFYADHAEGMISRINGKAKEVENALYKVKPDKLIALLQIAKSARNALNLLIGQVEKRINDKARGNAGPYPESSGRSERDDAKSFTVIDGKG